MIRSDRMGLLAAVLMTALQLGCSPSAEKQAREKATVEGAQEKAAAGSASRKDAWFENVAGTCGANFRHVSGHREKPYFPEIMGGGGTLFDLEGDGDLDLYFVQSGSLYEPGSEAGRNQLFRNRGDGTFEDISSGSGAEDRGYGMGVAAGDYDNDGDTDLFVTNVGPDVLLRNDGAGKFRDVTAEAGVGDPAWGTSATFADLDADGDLDLYIANYVNWSMANEMECPNSFGKLDFCLPTNYEAPSRDTLYRNNGNGTFTDVSEAAGLGANPSYGLGVTATDFTGDGMIDVFVANDTVFNQLWVNQGGLKFVDDALLRGCAVDENGQAKAGMGVMAVDFDDDADRDLLVVNLWKQSDSYYENDAGIFVDRSAKVGLGVASRPYTRFGMGFHDFNNDGPLDLYLANGRVEALHEPRTSDPYAEPNLLLAGTAEGTLREVVPLGGTVEPDALTSRAAIFGDLDNDGGVDVVVVNRDGPAQILKNVVAGRGHFLVLTVREDSGRFALGAVVTVRVGTRTITRDVISGYSYIASSDPRVHVGLGDAEKVDEVIVAWVGGERESFGSFAVDRFETLQRGMGQKVAASEAK